jgi:hypothetical protein
VSVAGIAALMLAALSLAALGCSSKSKYDYPAQNFGDGDFRIETTFDYEGRVTTSQLLFDSPDSWQLNDPVLGDFIIIGDESWHRFGSDWQPGWPGLRVIVTSNIEGMKSLPLASARRQNGPQRSGEQTSRWLLTSMTIGDNLASAAEKSAARHPEARDEILKIAGEFRGATATYEVLVGNTTGRIYDARVEIADDVSPSTQIIVVHYEETTVRAP